MQKNYIVTSNKLNSVICVDIVLKCIQTVFDLQSVEGGTSKHISGMNLG